MTRHKCKNCSVVFFDSPSRNRVYCSVNCRANSKEHKSILSNRSKNNSWGSLRKLDDKYRQKMREIFSGRVRPELVKLKTGKNNPNWRGGVTPKNKRIRMSAKFSQWRKSVFERDNYTCQICKIKGGILHPDHIKQFAYYPNLRFELSNGRTLCKECHMKTDTWGFKKHPLPEKQV